MRKMLFVLAMALCAIPTTYAQSHSDRISIGMGALYERGLDATVSWEHETKYHNTWEYFVNGYLKWEGCASCGHVCPESFWHSYNTWGIGISYKPCVSRGRNHYGNLRIGASGGSNTSDFLAGIHVGYEHSYVLRYGWQLYWQAKCDLMIPDRKDLFRTGIVIGFKIPTK